MEVEKYITELKTLTNSVKNEFNPLSEEQLNWKPDSESWSIAQILDHLITTNTSYFPVIESALNYENHLPWYSGITFIPDFFGRVLLNAVHPANRKKVKTFKTWEPKKSNLSRDIILKFENTQDELINKIKESEDLLKQEVVIASPANKYIIYKLSKAFEILIAHEKRHFQQASEIKLKF